MGSITLCALLLTSLLPTVLSKGGKGGGGGHSSGSNGGGSGPSEPVHFQPPPLAIAVLASDIIFFVVTAAQLSFTNNPKRLNFNCIPAGHRPSIAGIMSTLVCLLTAYAMGVTLTATTWSRHNSGEPSVGARTVVNIEIAAALFWMWADALMFAAVYIILRDCYIHAPTGKTVADEKPSRSGPPVLPFTIGASFIFLLMFVFATARVGLGGSAVLGQYTPAQAHDMLVISRHLYYAFLAVSFVATIFLLAFAIIVKKRNPLDKMASRTLTAIIPLFILYVIAEVVVTILMMQPPKIAASTIDYQPILILTKLLIYGVFHTVITIMFVFFLTRPRYWAASPSSEAMLGYIITPAIITPAPQQPTYQDTATPPPPQMDYTPYPQQQYSASPAQTTYYQPLPGHTPPPGPPTQPYAPSPPPTHYQQTSEYTPPQGPNTQQYAPSPPPSHYQQTSEYTAPGPNTHQYAPSPPPTHYQPANEYTPPQGPNAYVPENRYSQGPDYYSHPQPQMSPQPAPYYGGGNVAGGYPQPI